MRVPDSRTLGELPSLQIQLEFVKAHVAHTGTGVSVLHTPA
jgi:hypothetical protein